MQQQQQLENNQDLNRRLARMEAMITNTWVLSRNRRDVPHVLRPLCKYVGFSAYCQCAVHVELKFDSPRMKAKGMIWHLPFVGMRISLPLFKNTIQMQPSAPKDVHKLI
jgi:hypothetical protein